MQGEGAFENEVEQAIIGSRSDDDRRGGSDLPYLEP